jgi:hypothetical protein
MGILLIPKAQLEPAPLGRPVTIAHRGGQQVAVPMPSPASPTYEREMAEFSNWRGVVSPLGGAIGGWAYEPKRGDEALRPEYRPRRWGGSVPWNKAPRDMSGFQFKPK